ncbi:MAG: PTS sugar transporter subunit IIA [Candidatus Omnitrophica bacterium]|nr:PTS sugar transporter subunit IIA [Candidatus Omnitrophota bacterium]
MDIRRYIEESLIIGDLKAQTKEQAIAELVNAIFMSQPANAFMSCQDEVLKEVLNREKISTTGIGAGFAIPHARMEKWGDFLLAIGISRKGLDFSSMDGEPVRLICLMISSADKPYIILQMTATLISFLEKHDGVDALIKRCKDSKHIVEQLRSFAVNKEDLILARDITRPIQSQVELDDSIEKATRLMHLKHFEVLPVVDKQNKFCGQISCLDVFQYGLPNFFQNLNTVSFVRHIDPFEKYFRIQRSLKVRNFYKKTESIDESKTLIEIIFELTVKRKPKLFVTNEANELIGVIDRFTIIDKILIF